MNKKDIAKADKFIVNTFKKLTKFVLTLSSGLLLIIMPLVFLSFSIARFLLTEWMEGLGYLVLTAVSIYTARGIIKMIRTD